MKLGAQRANAFERLSSIRILKCPGALSFVNPDARHVHRLVVIDDDSQRAMLVRQLTCDTVQRDRILECISTYNAAETALIELASLAYGRLRVAVDGRGDRSQMATNCWGVHRKKKGRTHRVHCTHDAPASDEQV